MFAKLIFLLVIAGHAYSQNCSVSIGPCIGAESECPEDMVVSPGNAFLITANYNNILNDEFCQYFVTQYNDTIVQ